MGAGSRGGGVGQYLDFCWLCDTGLSVIVYSVVKYRPHLSHFQENVTIFKLSEEQFTLYLQYKHSGSLLTVNVKNFLSPKIRKCVTPILVA